MKYILLFALLLPSFLALAQQKTKESELTDVQQKELFASLKLDSSKLIREFSGNACKCIDSIDIRNKNAEKVAAEISACIDKQVTAFEMLISLSNAMSAGKKEINISLSTDKNSIQYIENYRLLETWLRDSCTSLINAMTSNEDESAKSISKIPAAKEQYQLGIDKLVKDNYKEALPFFEKAVQIDPDFAFAWDNIGVCYRRIGEYQKAIVAYKKSLQIEPKGVTPLHNIPVAYEYLKEYDKALDAYSQVEKIYPNDPEAFFGAGRLLYLYKQDYEKALDAMCKAYNLYTKTNSPYRVDAEKIIGMIFRELKKLHKEDVFDKILAANNINTK
jgi:tetratricopeptide (TPR) repeat protein